MATVASRPEQSHDFVSDECGADQDRAWSNLAQSDGVDKLLVREPSLFLYHDLLDQRNENEASSKQQHAGDEGDSEFRQAGDGFASHPPGGVDNDGSHRRNESEEQSIDRRNLSPAKIDGA